VLVRVVDITQKDASMPRILVFDGQSVYRTGLRSLVSANIPCVEVIEASNPNEAFSQIRNDAFDLVLVGTGRSSLGPLDSPKLAREASAATRFAIVSWSDTRADILASLAAGFHGFISKHQSDAEILGAITDVLSGRIYVPSLLAETGEAATLTGRFAAEVSPTLSTEADLLKLTKRQREVLSLLARGLSNKEIARALDIAEATTKIHLGALLRALGVRNRTEAAYKAGNLVNSTVLDSADLSPNFDKPDPSALGSAAGADRNSATISSGLVIAPANCADRIISGWSGAKNGVRR
jgi:DNA-binding NarL/FixJ family response regulator